MDAGSGVGRATGDSGISKPLSPLATTAGSTPWSQPREVPQISPGTRPGPEGPGPTPPESLSPDRPLTDAPSERPALTYVPMYVRTYLRTCLTLPTYVLTYVRTYLHRTYVRTYRDCWKYVRTYVQLTFSSSSVLLRPPPSSSVLQTPDPKPPPSPPSSRPQTPDPKPPRSQHAPAAPGGAGAVAGAAYSIGGTSRTCLEIRTAARTFIGEHRFICIHTYVRMYRSCSNVWLKGLASCSIH